jgi:hypothetical protein
MGEDTGIMRDPMVRVYMPTATAAEVAPGPIPGRWVAESTWPAPNVVSETLFLAGRALAKAPGPPDIAKVAGGSAVGLGKVEWVPFAPTELPREQSPDDARSTVFDTPALTEDMEILGAPAFRVRVAANRPNAKLAIRLCEVDPQGRSWLVTYGVLNLTHRGGHEHPEALEPGRFYDVVVPLNFTAHRFKAGYRLRAALSEGLWPLVWPSPDVVDLEIDTARSRLELPRRRPPAVEAAMPIALADPFPSDPKGWPVMTITETAGTVRVVETWPDSATAIAEIGETISGAGPNVDLSFDPAKPESCRWSAVQSARYLRTGWDVAVHAEVTVSAGAHDFHVEERTVATLNGDVVSDVKHARTIPRALM